MMLLSCPLCCKPHFEGVDSLRTTLINVATAPLTCPVCHDTLNGLDKLTIHLFGHVNNNHDKSSDSVVTVSSCIKCTNNVNKEELHKDNNRPNITQACSNVQDAGQQSLALKLQNDQNEKEDVISCDICSFTFTDKNILDMHQKLLHHTIPDEKTGKYSYHCHLCSKRFRMRGSLMVHLRVAHYGFSNHVSLRPNLLCVGENSQNNSQELDIGVKSTNKLQDCKQWSCDVCAKMFTTKYFLKKHKRLHTGEMPYSCTICNKSFTFQQSYHKHMLYHSSEKPYICTECGRAFKEHSTLQNHTRIHSGERPFGCEICGKRFRQRVSYLVHMRIHTGVMPYKCTACNKSFRYKVSQRSHKCLMNPPGSVIKVNESSSMVSSLVEEKKSLIPKPDVKISGKKETKGIMTVDYDTGYINLIRGNTLEEGDVSESYKTYQDQQLNNHNPNLNPKEAGQVHKKEILKYRDTYSMVMSPILPEVESLCLNNNSPISHPTSPVEENIQLIREKCLEELFK